jgi:hypothetical protein
MRDCSDQSPVTLLSCTSLFTLAHANSIGLRSHNIGWEAKDSMTERSQHGVYAVSFVSRFVCSYEGKKFLLTHFLVTISSLISQPCYNFCFYGIFWWNLVDLLGLKNILSSYFMTLRRIFLIELTNSRPSEWITFLLFFAPVQSWIAPSIRFQK